MTTFRMVAVSLLLLCPSARADIPIRAQRIATGLSRPLYVTSAPGDPDRIYILEQWNSGGVGTSGAVRIFDYNTGTLNASPFLTIPTLATDNEQGALGLTFHPNYQSNGLFYLNVTDSSWQTQIRRYTRVDANTASTTFSNVLTIDQPQDNHNGGWIGFGPNDGYLYIASGDGGNFNDQGNGHTPTIGNAQDTSAGNLLGKMLRIDINGTDVNGQYSIPPSNPFAGSATEAEEIWAYGLRNPWRASFDRANGDLYIGDVGQGSWEEVDYQPANSTGGENYGWRAREGANDTGLLAPTPDMIDPIHEYSHAEGIAVTGGYVYRGSENDALLGTYIFADYGAATIWSFKYDGTTKTKFRTLSDDIIFESGQSIGLISSFGEDAQGRIYVTDLSDGEVYRLVPAFPGDANLDDFVDKTDLTRIAQNWQRAGDALWEHGDFTDDGNVDLRDLYVLSLNWQLGPDALAAALAENGLPTNVPEAGGAILVMGLWFLYRRVRVAPGSRGEVRVPL